LLVLTGYSEEQFTMPRFTQTLRVCTALFGGVVVWAGSCIAAGANERPPNIVIIFADDLGYADLGCFGSVTNHTPCLDRLSAEGTRFTSCYVGQAVCTASRAALLTGCYPNRIGMAGALNHTSPSGIGKQERLLSELLQSRGYATAAFGKWHLGLHPPFWPTNRGFDEFFGIPYSNDNGPLHPVVRTMPPLPLYEGADVVEIDPDQSQLTRRCTDRAVRFIEQHREQPFFLYVPHVMPHVPIFASEPWRGTTGHGIYADVVAELDASVGEIVAAIDRNGLAANTLVVFASDNGPFLSYGNHAGSAVPFREGKLTAFEGGMRVPCIARWPGHVPGARVTNQILSTLDLFASIVKLTGADMPAHKTDGLDLRPLLFGAAGATGRDTFFFYSGDELHAVRSGDWKLHLPHDFMTVAGEPGRDGKPANIPTTTPKSMAESGVRGIASRHGYAVTSLPLSLYHLAADPGETKDVAAEHPEVVARLHALAAEARADLGDALTGTQGAGTRPVGDFRPTVPDGVRRISDLEYARVAEPVPMALLLDLYLPADAANGRAHGGVQRPVVLWIHGGGWKHGSKEQCPLLWLAGEGVAVASINYRSSWQARWPAQIDDCREAISWLRREAATYGLDPERIVVAGASAGGHLAVLVGTAGTGAAPVQGVIDLFGPSDLLTMPANTPGPDRSAKDLATSNAAQLLGGPVHERPDVARAASGLFHVSPDDPPFLILHGDADPLVPLEQSRRLDAALRQAGVTSRFTVLAGAGHGGPSFNTAGIRAQIRELVGIAPADR
jgi:arylsulfatase A-like enzyme/dienelactone hydrolase